MRNILVLLAASTALAACGGGGGPTFAGSSAPPTTGSGGTVGGGTGNGEAPHSFVDPSEPTSYQGIGGAQTFAFQENIIADTPLIQNGDFAFIGDSSGPTAELYAGQASTARNSQIEITFDPREAVYTLVINDPLSNTSINTRFQDPSSRTDFGGAEEPQWGVPNLQFANVEYFESGDGDPLSPVGGSGEGAVQNDRNDRPSLGLPESALELASFFLQTPGTSTQFVTFAGFARNAFTYAIDDQTGRYTVTNDISRGAFAFGERTALDDVPDTGVFNLSGNMLASAINNPTLDEAGSAQFESYFQWIEGTVNLTVDFAADEVRDIDFVGTITGPQIPALTQYSASFNPNDVQSFVPAGSRFEASGSATINLVTAGGFLGSIDTARFIAQNGNNFSDGSTLQELVIEGSSIDGAFFGPNGEEIGGGFRIVGGVPDQRIDILGAFSAGSN